MMFHSLTSNRSGGRETGLWFRYGRLVSCNRSSLTKPGYTGEDLIGSFGPDKRFGIFVVLVQVIPNCFFQFTRTAVNTTPDLLSRQQREKAFDQIDPR